MLSQESKLDRACTKTSMCLNVFNTTCRYHNHANYGGFHRADRSPAPKVVSLQGDFRGDTELDVVAALQGFSDSNGLEFRRERCRAAS